MTKRSYLECDICGETIKESSESRLVRFKTRRGRWLKLLVYRWRGGYPETNPRWVGQHTDLCGDCWDQVTSVVRQRVTDA